MSREKPKRVTHRNRRRSGFHSIEWIRALNWFMRGWGRRRIAHLHSWKALGPSKAQLRISSICWKCGKRAKVKSRGAINNRAEQKKAFPFEWIARIELIFANCTWPANLLANHFGNVERQWGTKYSSLLRQLTPVSILRSRIQIDYDLFIVNKHRGV